MSETMRSQSEIRSGYTIRLSCENPQGLVVRVRLGSEEKTLGALSKEAIFSVGSPGIYWIDIEEDAAMEDEPFPVLWAQLVSNLVKAILCTISTASDGKWWRGARAYRIKSRIRVELYDELDVRLSFGTAAYDDEHETWSPPVFEAIPALEIETQSIPNPKGIQNAYREAMLGFKTLAYAIVGCFLVLTVAVWDSSNPVGSICSGAVAVVLGGIVIWNIKWQSGKYRSLMKRFHQES